MVLRYLGYSKLPQMPLGGTKLGRGFLRHRRPWEGEQDGLCSLSFPGISDATRAYLSKSGRAWLSRRKKEGKGALQEPSLIQESMRHAVSKQSNMKPAIAPELEGTEALMARGVRVGLAFHQPLLTNCLYSPGLRSL